MAGELKMTEHRPGKAPNGVDFDEIKHRLEEIHEMTTQHGDALKDLTVIVSEKVDRLIDVIAGKGMIPVDVFRWLIIFVITFVMCMQFGVEGVKALIGHLR